MKAGGITADREVLELFGKAALCAEVNPSEAAAAAFSPVAASRAFVRGVTRRLWLGSNQQARVAVFPTLVFAFVFVFKVLLCVCIERKMT